MRWHKAFPRPGDRIRLAVPLPTDESEPHARYGTVLERSCGQSNALRVRWDREGDQAAAGPDAGMDVWLADAGWYWDKAHLEVIDKHAGDSTVAPVSTPSEEADWLTASPRAAAGRSGIGVDGSLDAAAEWEAALASEIDAGPDANWEQLLAAAMGNGVSAAPAREPAPAPVAPAPARPPAPTAAHETPAAENGSHPYAAPPPTSHKDTRKRTSAPEGAAVHELEPAPGTPVAAPVAPWKGDDILPRPRGGGKRWGRR